MPDVKQLGGDFSKKCRDPITIRENPADTLKNKDYYFGR